MRIQSKNCELRDNQADRSEDESETYHELWRALICSSKSSMLHGFFTLVISYLRGMISSLLFTLFHIVGVLYGRPFNTTLVELLLSSLGGKLGFVGLVALM